MEELREHGQVENQDLGVGDVRDEALPPAAEGSRHGVLVPGGRSVVPAAAVWPGGSAGSSRPPPGRSRTRASDASDVRSFGHDGAYASFVDRFDVNEPIDPVTFVEGGTTCAGHAAKRNGISSQAGA